MYIRIAISIELRLSVSRSLHLLANKIHRLHIHQIVVAKIIVAIATAILTSLLIAGLHQNSVIDMEMSPNRLKRNAQLLCDLLYSWLKMSGLCGLQPVFWLR